MVLKIDEYFCSTLSNTLHRNAMPSVSAFAQMEFSRHHANMLVIAQGTIRFINGLLFHRNYKDIHSHIADKVDLINVSCLIATMIK